MFRVIIFIVASILFVPCARADESFRISRPQAGAAQLGDVIYAGMRTPMPRTSFERWRQNYCAPFICNMVLCHGSCGDFEEHCPSFSESGRVIHLDVPGCMTPASHPAETASGTHSCCALH